MPSDFRLIGGLIAIRDKYKFASSFSHVSTSHQAVQFRLHSFPFTRDLIRSFLAMRSVRSSMGLAAAAALRVTAASLADVCTTTYVQSKLPTDVVEGITLETDSVTANAVYNHSVSAGDLWPGKSGLNFCNVTFAYTRDGVNDTVSFDDAKMIVSALTRPSRPMCGTGSPARTNSKAATSPPAVADFQSVPENRDSGMALSMAHRQVPRTVVSAAGAPSSPTSSSPPMAAWTSKSSTTSAIAPSTR